VSDDETVAKADEALARFGHLVPKTLAALNLPPHADFDDLLSVGRMALLQAATQLRPGATAESYLRLRIRGAMLDYIRDVTWIPRGVFERKRQLDEAVRVLELRHGRSPSDAEIASQLKMTREQFEDFQSRTQVHNLVSAYAPANDQGEEPSDLLSNVPDGQALDPAAETEKQDLIEAIFTAMHHLPKRLQQVLALYYHEELQMNEIAQAMDITESRVSQMHAQAIQLIKRHLDSQSAREGLVSRRGEAAVR